VLIVDELFLVATQSSGALSQECGPLKVISRVNRRQQGNLTICANVAEQGGQGN